MNLSMLIPKIDSSGELNVILQILTKKMEKSSPNASANPTEYFSDFGRIDKIYVKKLNENQVNLAFEKFFLKF